MNADDDDDDDAALSSSDPETSESDDNAPAQEVRTLSAYEQRRLDNIFNNNAALRTLGLVPDSSSTSPDLQASSTPPPPQQPPMRAWARGPVDATEHDDRTGQPAGGRLRPQRPVAAAGTAGPGSRRDSDYLPSGDAEGVGEEEAAEEHEDGEREGEQGDNLEAEYEAEHEAEHEATHLLQKLPSPPSTRPARTQGQAGPSAEHEGEEGESGCEPRYPDAPEYAVLRHHAKHDVDGFVCQWEGHVALEALLGRLGDVPYLINPEQNHDELERHRQPWDSKQYVTLGRAGPHGNGFWVVVRRNSDGLALGTGEGQSVVDAEVNRDLCAVHAILTDPSLPRGQQEPALRGKRRPVRSHSMYASVRIPLTLGRFIRAVHQVQGCMITVHVGTRLLWEDAGLLTIALEHGNVMTLDASIEVTTPHNL